MSAYPVNPRRGRVLIAAGVAAALAGFVLQAVNVHSFATEAPPQIMADAGGTALLGEIAGLLIVTGIVLAIVGVVRYAQSAGGAYPVRMAPAGPAVGVTPMRDPGAGAPASMPAFCSSCGARIAGEGRFCASCGTPTGH